MTTTQRHAYSKLKPNLRYDLSVPAIYTERPTGGNYAVNAGRTHTLSVYDTQMFRSMLLAVRPLALSTLGATACSAWTQSSYGHVPGNNYAVGPQNATYDCVVVGGGTTGLANA